MTEILLAILFIFVIGGLVIGALQLIKSIMSMPVNITIKHEYPVEPVLPPPPEFDKQTQDELDKKATFDNVVKAINDIMNGDDK